MPADRYLQLHGLPDLRAPYLVAAFAGWNDASQVATHALSTLVQAWSAKRFAEMDSEEFFDFSETRPTISLGSTGQRSVDWPTTHFYAHRLEDAEHDVVLLVGTEPQLRWRTFCRTVLGLADQLGACCLVTLGGLLADVPHTIEPRLSGFVSNSSLLPELQALGMRVSTYEGPTGIVGVLHDAWRQTGKPTLSLWGNVPHYISAAPNPQVSLALLRRLSIVLQASLPISPLEVQETAFRSQVEEALAENPEATEYVRELEKHYTDENPPQSGPELIAELEEFLRNKRPESDEPPA